jgi:Tfp pilus assembly protein PilN
VREPEFLPRWYPLLLRRRRIATIQVWVTLAAVAGLGVWALASERTSRLYADHLAVLHVQLVQSSADLQRLEEIEAVKHKLERQDQIIRRLGVHVPASRILEAISQLMPPHMALSDLEIATQQQAEPLTTAQRAHGAVPRIHRQLKVDLKGVAPTEDDLATFLTQLVAVPYFTQVELVKAKDSSSDGHLMRWFEVTFALDLDYPNLEEAPAAAVTSADTTTEGQ